MNVAFAQLGVVAGNAVTNTASRKSLRIILALPQGKCNAPNLRQHLRDLLGKSWCQGVRRDIPTGC
jgi:hypothetical protein